MRTYLIGKLIVKDWNWYRDYRSVTEPLVAEYGGRYLVKGGASETLEGGEHPGDAFVVIEFPDRQSLTNWYEDPRYAPMRELRRTSGVIAELSMVDGLPDDD